MENTRSIHTGLYSTIACEIMDSVFGQLSDGWGENNPRNDRFWEHGDVTVADDGEVILSIDANATKHWWSSITHRTEFKENGFYGMTDDEVLAWMAKMIKKTVKMELTDRNCTSGWKRNNDYELRYLGRNETVTVSDAYLVYDVLLERNVKPAAYLNFEKVIGARKSDEEIARTKAINEATASAQKIYDDKYNEMMKNKEEAIKKIESEYKFKVLLIREEYEQAMEKIQAM